MPSRCFTSARSELPCAATSTVAPGAQVGDDRVVPPRQHPLEHVLQALGPGQHVAGERGVALVDARVGIVDRRADRAADVVRAPPDLHLLGAELLARSPPCSCPAARRSDVRSAATTAAPGSTTARTRRARARRCGSRAPAPTCARCRAAMPALREVAPGAARLARRPRSVRSTSTQPVKRFSRFQVLWPWRSSTSVYGTVASVAADASSDTPFWRTRRSVLRNVGSPRRDVVHGQRGPFGDGGRDPARARARAEGHARRART